MTIVITSPVMLIWRLTAAKNDGEYGKKHGSVDGGNDD